MSRLLRLTLVVAVLASGLVFATGAALADTTVTIDFEGLAEGEVVSAVSVGNGISGGTVAGSIAVEGLNTDFPTENAAIIFDAECDGSAANCTGDDPDLFFPGQGNVLIIAENLLDANNDDLIDDPDDATSGGTFFFDFTSFGPGSVTVENLWLGDLGDIPGETGEIQLFAGATLIATVPLPTLTDNQATTVTVNTAGVTQMVVQFFGTGAIDDIVLTVEEENEVGDEGCTPGYWKQSHHFDSWVGYTPSQTIESVFDVPDDLGLDNDSLSAALGYKGGQGVTAAARLLLKQAVASVLNAANAEVAFPLSEAGVIANVNTALASLNRDTMLSLKDELDRHNNLGCPLN